MVSALMRFSLKARLQVAKEESETERIPLKKAVLTRSNSPSLKGYEAGAVREFFEEGTLYSTYSVVNY